MTENQDQQQGTGAGAAIESEGGSTMPCTLNAPEAQEGAQPSASEPVDEADGPEAEGNAEKSADVQPETEVSGNVEVKLTQDWGDFKEGETAKVNAHTADELIAAGKAEAV